MGFKNNMEGIPQSSVMANNLMRSLVMKTIKPQYAFLILFFLGSLKVKAQQDVLFTQFVFNGLEINPGYAGYKEVTNLNLTYRSQWIGLKGAPQSINVSIDGLTANEKVGLGFQVLQDKIGAQANLSSYFSYAYRLIMGKYARLSFGLAAGLNQYSIDGNQLFTIDPDPSSNTLTQRLIQPDLKAGIYYADDKFFMAVSATNMLSNLESYNPSYLVIKTARHYYFQTGGLIGLGPTLQLKPSIIIREDFNAPMNLDLNLLLLLNQQLWIGSTYRTGINLGANSIQNKNLSSNDSFSFILEYYINDRFRMGYSYDYSLSSISNISNGSHELSIGYTFFSKHPHLACPRFF